MLNVTLMKKNVLFYHYCFWFCFVLGFFFWLHNDTFTQPMPKSIIDRNCLNLFTINRYLAKLIFIGMYLIKKRYIVKNWFGQVHVHT